jgi:hypothetical protein
MTSRCSGCSAEILQVAIGRPDLIMWTSIWFEAGLSRFDAASRKGWCVASTDRCFKSLVSRIGFMLFLQKFGILSLVSCSFWFFCFVFTGSSTEKHSSFIIVAILPGSLLYSHYNLAWSWPCFISAPFPSFRALPSILRAGLSAPI